MVSTIASFKFKNFKSFFSSSYKNLNTEAKVIKIGFQGNFIKAVKKIR